MAELTKEQTDQFTVYVDKWLEIGLSTEPLDFENAKKAVCKAYRLAGLDEPTNFHVADSPVSAIKLIQELDPKLSKQEILNQMIFGAHEAHWLAYYDYMENVMDVKGLEILEGLKELALYSGWLNVYEDTVVFQHRPEAIKFDENKRLHCQDGPAVKYRDGYAVYSWHGVTIPDEWITNPESLTPEKALKWENVEQRRCACEILGWSKILKKLKAKVIDEDGDPEIGTLVEVSIPQIGKEKFLKVLCGTGREFALPVPPTMKTALEANAWTYGLTPDDLRDLEVRT